MYICRFLNKIELLLSSEVFYMYMAWEPLKLSPISSNRSHYWNNIMLEVKFTMY